MAQNENILTRLGKLFRSNIIVRQTDDKQLKVKDVDFSQVALTSNFIDRYTRLMHGGSHQYRGWGQKYAGRVNKRNWGRLLLQNIQPSKQINYMLPFD